MTTHPRYPFWWALALVVALTAAVLMVPGRANADVAPPAEPTTTCLEDEPCWDCTVMGNGICGPPPTIASAAAWIATAPPAAPTCMPGDQYRQNYVCSPAPRMGVTPGHTCRQVWLAYPSPMRLRTICRGPA